MSMNLGSTLACHVLCLLPLLLAQSTNQKSCDNHVVCRGNRPVLSTGCCPVEAGQACQPANGTHCDTELGFSCLNADGDVVEDSIGICQGRFNLHLTSVAKRNVTLAWSEFASPGYVYEYVLLMREQVYHPDVAQWRIKEIGSQPFYTLRRLTPATLYFLKVAVWENARLQIIGNTSETIMVETRSVEFCEHRGQVYLVDERFVHECEDNCTCLPTGQFQCHPLCPDRGVPEVEEGCHVTAGNTCCDDRIVCPVGGEPCVMDGQSYSHGEVFEIGCRVCTCNQGQAECVYPEECHVMEPTESCTYPQSREVEGQCCPEWYCANTCNYDNRTYNHLEYFTSDHCGLCQCDTVDSIHCAPDCPPVEMVLPDAACPDPHIRQDGCCDTLYCHDLSLDTAQFIRRMFALSYSPVTLTLSFEVDPQTEVNGVPLYCQYEILYANTSDPFVTWNRRLVQPVDVSIHHDQPHMLDPTEALTRDNAIVVGDRAYVTLSGMYPNTTYYVKIIPLDSNWDDMASSASGSFNYSDSKISALVVVKTMPLDNITSCFHNGTEVLHGDYIKSHCSKLCMCVFGKITCQSACPAELVVMATSTTCPQPRLEKREGECCPEWTCYPSVTGCRYRGLIIESGQSVTDECQVCACSNATVHCRSVCPPAGEAPRPGCKLVNISGQCCTQWQCQLESHLPHGVKSSVLIHFHGSCLSSTSNFLEDMREKILSHVTSIMGCSTMQTDLVKFCSTLQVKILCPGLLEDVSTNRKRRSTHSDRKNPKTPVVVSVYMNFSSVIPDVITVQYVKFAGLQLVSSLNSSFSIILDNGQVMTTLDGAQFEGESFICDPGFLFVKEFCILSEIESILSFKPNLQLSSLHVTNSSATIEWPPLGDQVLRHITGLLIEHRHEGSVQWLSSSKFDSVLTSFNLTSLNSDQSFSVRLIALTPWSGKERWKMGEVHFRTRPTPAAMTTSDTLMLEKITVAEYSAFFYWDRLPDQAKLISITVLYKEAHQDLYQHKQCFSPVDINYVQLKNLEPNTAYSAELIAFLSTDMTLKSFPVHFVTLSLRSSSAELLIAVVVSCVVTALTSVILSLSCVVWRQNRKKGKNNGFENKIFGIQLQNNNGEINTESASNPAAN